MERLAQTVLTIPTAPSNTSTSVSSFPSNRQRPAEGHGYPGVRPPKYHWYASRYLCAITVAFIAFLSLLRLVRALRRHPRKAASSVSCGIEPNTSGSLLQRLVRAGETFSQKWLFLVSFPKWLYGPDNIADALCTLVYCVLLFFFSLNKTTWMGGEGNAANQMGVMVCNVCHMPTSLTAFSQLPLILLLIAKNNPISLLTGITYQKLNFLHRAASRACLLCSWVHALAWTPRVWESGHFSHAYIIWGLLALFGFSMLWTTSFRAVRRVAWEFFIISHILFTLLFLIGAIFHWQRLMYWVWPALVLWILDRIIRTARLVKINRLGPISWGFKATPCGQSVVELIDHDIIRVSIRRDGFEWSAGQHAFLWIPSLSQSIHESHPFSFANVPSEDEKNAIFIIRVHSGVTQRLRNALTESITTDIPIYLEGPYGTIHDLGVYSTVLLLAGGTGITFCFSHLLGLVNGVRVGKAITTNACLVWHVRQREDVNWITPLLNEVTRSLQGLSHFAVEIKIYVTRPDEDRTSLSHNEDTAFPRECSLDGTEVEQDRMPFLSTPELSSASKALINWHFGRADLKLEVKGILSNAGDRVNVTVCGPQSLLLASRKAVQESTPNLGLITGYTSVDYFEETLGA